MDTKIQQKQSMARLIAFFSNHTCGEACWSAKEEVCRCECGGKNHGIMLRDGVTGIRAAKIGGYRYELLAVGRHGELTEQGATLTAEHWLAMGKTKAREYYGDQSDRVLCERPDFFWIDSKDGGKEKVKGWIEMHELKGSGSLYCVKYATLSQLIRWQELEYFNVYDEQTRYNAKAAILWKRADVPSYLSNTSDKIKEG